MFFFFRWKNANAMVIAIFNNKQKKNTKYRILSYTLFCLFFFCGFNVPFNQRTETNVSFVFLFIPFFAHKKIIFFFNKSWFHNLKKNGIDFDGKTDFKILISFSNYFFFFLALINVEFQTVYFSKKKNLSRFQLNTWMKCWFPIGTRIFNHLEKMWKFIGNMKLMPFTLCINSLCYCICKEENFASSFHGHINKKKGCFENLMR